MVIYKDLNHVETERRDTTYRIPALRGGILHVVSRCYVLNQLGNATSDPTAFKIPQVPSSVLAVLRLYSRSFRILNAVKSSIALSNYYIDLSNILEHVYICNNQIYEEDRFKDSSF